jgi:hypothetical protein
MKNCGIAPSASAAYSLGAEANSASLSSTPDSSFEILHPSREKYKQLFSAQVTFLGALAGSPLVDSALNAACSQPPCGRSAARQRNTASCVSKENAGRAASAAHAAGDQTVGSTRAPRSRRGPENG